VALRRWRPGDAAALAAAWADPEIGRHASVPAGPPAEAAARWIGGAGLRAATGVSVDLVVGPPDGDEVWGEVGVARLRLRVPTGGAGPPERVVWDTGWWAAAAHRRRGVATAAVRLLVGWAAGEAGLVPLVARIPPGHRASEAVAARAGFARRGRWDATHDLWLRPDPTPGPGRGAV